MRWVRSLISKIDRRSGAVIAIIVAIIVISVYSFAFFKLRYHYNATRWFPGDISHAGCPVRINVYFFSKNPAKNSALYYLFFPMHRWLLSGHPESDMNDCETTDVYLYSERQLNMVPYSERDLK